MDSKTTFIQLVRPYSYDEQVVNTQWNEIEKCYSHKKRHYHTLKHIGSLLNELNEVKDLVNDWDILLFSVFYHDVVYNILKTNNEEKSAEFAAKQLLVINFPAIKIELCKKQILATKSHLLSSDSDTNLFTDADLSILGKLPEIYLEYMNQVRKEYSIYPDFVYNPGRKKVISHFLSRERIYKTSFFFKKYEAQARVNLQNELMGLPHP